MIRRKKRWRAAGKMSTELFETPELYPWALDVETDEIIFMPMTPGDYRKSSFLDHHISRTDKFTYRAKLADFIDYYEVAAPVSKELNYIFHTAFVGSTLLTRLLDGLPDVFSIRE